MTVDTKRLATDPGYWDECGAPEDATHFSPEKADFDPFWMKFDGRWRAKYIGSTRDSWGLDDPDDNPERYIPRPQKPEVEWDGEGLPPVGCECEVDASGINGPADWRHCFVVGKDEEGDLVVKVYSPDNEDYVFSETRMRFRPIRTKEQRQRDELAVEIWSLDGRSKDHAYSVADHILSLYNLEPKDA